MSKNNPQRLPKAPLLEKLSLYQFQREAVERMRIYISAFTGIHTDIFGTTQGSGLVHMPTGSGKTAVIAALSRCIPEVNSVLVLCPRIVLRDQLFQELQGNFFKKLKRSPKCIPKSVHCFADEKNRKFLKNLPDDAVVITTIQKLHAMCKGDRQSFSKLVDRVDLVIFDEGHYEPALCWSETVRQIGKPRIIFTATPFRNDLKLFDVDLQHAYSYSFHKAVSKSIIRGVDILSVGIPKSPKDFVNLVLQFYKTLFAPMPRKSNSLDDSPRVIIRCDDAPQIRQIAATLRSKRIKFVAIHEKFQDNDDHGTQWQHVPDPQKTKALIWIHQYKLIEGVDDWRFQLLAFYGKGPASVRPMVQQVGRIIRNPLKKRNSKGYVLDTFEGMLKNQWSGYLKHDEYIEREGLKGLNTNTRILQALQEAHPPTLYIDRRFRSPLSLETLKPEEDLQLPLKVNVFYRGDDFKMSTVAEAIKQGFEEGDRIIVPPDIEDDRCIILSIRFTNSRYLIEKFFMEAKLCVTLVRLAGRYVCFFDSGNLTPNELPGFGIPVAPRELRRILKGRVCSDIRRVSLINSSVAPDCIQSRSVTTYSSIERTPPAFDDHAFVCTTADGCLDANPRQQVPGVRRYVGFSNARLSEGSTAKYYSLTEYHEWLDKVAKILQGTRKPDIPGLERYAEVREAPSKTKPTSIVLDVSALGDSYLTTQDNRPIEIIQEDVQVGSDGKFSVIANGRKRSAKIEYDGLSEKYRLISSDLDKTYYNIDQKDKSIVQRLNAEQAFRIIPEASSVVYAAGAFHDPQIGLGPTYARKHRQILDVIHHFSVFGEINSEKGLKGVLSNARGWEHHSLFGLIDRVGGDRLRISRLTKAERQIAPFFNNVDLLVCDDMGTELADFIMVQSVLPGRKNVVFIHCKALKPQQATEVSASGLANVCSQAVKNIGELSLFSSAMVDRTRKWSQPWTARRLGTVKKRIRKGPKKATQAWDSFRTAVEDPNADREIWLFLGNILSRQEFQKRLSNGKHKRLETMQALYELFSTLSTIRSRNIRFLVFCNP